ncbi:MAG: nucleoside monophosphate kinase [Phycisphaerales bacterium]|nr:nucleoside monophosphate kinase [Phycisphaerales bacterium]
MRYKAILLFGAPGSGKGTQGKIIGQIPGFFHSSTGDIFRSLDLRSEMGRVFWEYASRGELVPDEITIRVWRQYITGMEWVNQFHPDSEVIVLDGLPRNVNQARLLTSEIEVVKILYLRAEPNKMIERLRRRALKESRFDDANDAVIRKRMLTFERDTRPVLDYYPQDLVVRIDAMKSQIEVLTDILPELTPIKHEMDAAVEAADRAYEQAREAAAQNAVGKS